MGGNADAEKDDRPIKKMDLKEFKDEGYLLEINRKVLHPLGLAMSFRCEKKDGEWVPTGEVSIMDYREDPEGIRFSREELDEEAREKIQKINEDFQEKLDHRRAEFGWGVQPIRESMMEENNDGQNRN